MKDDEWADTLTGDALWAQRESERRVAVKEAATALGLNVHFQVYVNYTQRTSDDVSFECPTIEDVKEQLLELRRQLTDNEGDEIAYITTGNGDEFQEIDFDMREDGEPFSWHAVDLVKNLAKAEPGDLAEWIVKARELLK